MLFFCVSPKKSLRKVYLQNLTKSKVQHFAAEAKALDASELKKITQPKRATLLLCLIYAAQVQTCDNLAEMFLKQMGKIHKKAKEELEYIQHKHQETNEKLVSFFTKILQVFNDELTAGKIIEQIKNILTLGVGC